MVELGAMGEHKHVFFKTKEWTLSIDDFHWNKVKSPYRFLQFLINCLQMYFSWVSSSLLSTLVHSMDSGYKVSSIWGFHHFSD